MGAETKEKRGTAAKGAEKGKRGGWRWEIFEGLGGPAITSGGGRGGGVLGSELRTQRRISVGLQSHRTADSDSDGWDGY
jgi:hypothetical protein